MEWRVPLSDIDFGPEEPAAVQQVLASRWLTLGAITQQFEQEFAEYTRARHAIAAQMPLLLCIWLVLRSGWVRATR